MIRVLESVKRMPVYSIGSVSRQHAAGSDDGALLRRSGPRSDLPGRSGDSAGARPAVYLGIHLALGLGVAVGLVPPASGLPAARHAVRHPDAGPDSSGWRDGLLYGVRIGVTYMGYVVCCGSRPGPRSSWSPSAAAGCTRSPG